MNFKNGYKLLYQKLTAESKIYASKSTIPTAEDVEVTFGDLTEEELKNIKLFYEKGDNILGSATGIPTTDDVTIPVLANGETVIGGDVEYYTPIEYFTFEPYWDTTKNYFMVSKSEKASELSEIRIPPRYNGGIVYQLRDFAFSDLGSLTTIVLPEGVGHIDRQAFERDTNLVSVSFPSTLTYIGYQIFRDCDKLSSINYSGTVDQWNTISKDSSWDYYNTSDYTIYCTDGTISKSGEVTYYNN